MTIGKSLGLSFFKVDDDFSMMVENNRTENIF